MRILKSKLLGGILIVFLVLAWEAYSRTGNSPVYFPPFLEVLGTLCREVTSLSFLNDILQTLWRCVVGFSVAALLAIPLGTVIGRVQVFFHLFNPLIEFFRPMPSAAVIPVAILFLGIDNEMKLFVICFGSTWPILVNTIDGVRGIDSLYLKTCSVFGLGGNRRYLRVILPAAMPSIFTGLRISVAISLILTVTVEMIVGGNGIGYYILDAERSFKFKEMYAGVLAIGVLGYVINMLAVLVEKRVLFWYYREDEADG